MIVVKQQPAAAGTYTGRWAAHSNSSRPMSLFRFYIQQLAGVWIPACDFHYLVKAWLQNRFCLPAKHLLYPHQRLQENLFFACLDCLELVGAAETYYEVLLPDALFDTLETIQDLEDTLIQQLKHMTT